MSRNYPPLRPAPTAENSQASSAELKSKKSQTPARVACNPCQKRKSACDAKRPSCTPCARRGVECVYRSQELGETPTKALKRENEELRNTNKSLMDLMELLRDIPAVQSYEILQQLGTSSDPAAVLASAKSRLQGGSDLLGESLTSAMLPLATSRAENELMVRFPSVYLDLASINSFVPLPRLQTYWDRSQRDVMTEESATQAVLLTHLVTAEPLNAASVGNLSSPRVTQSGPLDTSSTGTSKNSVYCDKRLENLDIKKWTKVPITNESAARTISLYLEIDHPLLACFDTDLFLDSLVDSPSPFCSPLLVSSVLCWACSMYTFFNIEAAVLSRAFYTEATAIWDQLRLDDSITTVASSVLLGIGCFNFGKDTEGVRFLHEGVEMAQRLKLFGVEETPGLLEHFRSMSDELLQFHSHVAWGAFNIVTLYRFFAKKQGPGICPILPVPGEQVQGREDTLAMRLSPWTLPPQMGQTVTVMSRVNVAIQDMLLKYYGVGTSLTESINLNIAMPIYQNLLELTKQLDPGIARGALPPHHDVFLHMYYHLVILDLFRPFVEGSETVNIPTFPYYHDTARSIFNASMRQLQYLNYFYRSRYETTTYSLWWHISLLYIANAAINDDNFPARMNHFRASIAGYQGLYRCYPITEGIIRGLLAMAVGKRLISSVQARTILREFLRHGKHHRASNTARGSFAVDLDLSMSDSVAAQAGNMADKFDDMNLFDSFTHGGDLDLVPRSPSD